MPVESRSRLHISLAYTGQSNVPTIPLTRAVPTSLESEVTFRCILVYVSNNAGEHVHQVLSRALSGTDYSRYKHSLRTGGNTYMLIEFILVLRETYIG